MKAGNDVFFYDTYALHAIARGASSYAAFAKEPRILTSYMNLYEIYYKLSQQGYPELASALFQELIACAVHPEPETIKAAAEFRLKNVKKKFSYIDCLGYTIAQETGFPFLTGDEGFKGLPNVKFVKE